MSDDIVERLRQSVRMCSHGWNLGSDWYPAPTECSWCVRQRDAADEIERLRAEVQSQTFWAELLAGNNCSCPSDDTFVCLPCAYRQTMQEARRG